MLACICMRMYVCMLCMMDGIGTSGMQSGYTHMYVCIHACIHPVPVSMCVYVTDVYVYYSCVCMLLMCMYIIHVYVCY